MSLVKRPARRFGINACIIATSIAALLTELSALPVALACLASFVAGYLQQSSAAILAAASAAFIVLVVALAGVGPWADEAFFLVALLVLFTEQTCIILIGKLVGWAFQ